MVKVTDKDYYLDGFAEQACQAVAKRVQERKQDILILIDGREGSGKSNSAVALAYRIADLTGREFNVKNMFFDLGRMNKYAGNTKDQIIVWDEAAAGGLAHSWSNASQKKLKSMLMMCRKLRHVFIFCIPRFYRLSSDLIERSYCMFHMYEDKEEKLGNFMFYGQEGLERLYENWKKKRYPQYWSFKKLHGHFTWVLPRLIDEEAYEKAKDEAIKKLVNEVHSVESPREIIYKTKREIAKKAWFIYKNLRKVSDLVGIDRKTAGIWKKEEGWGVIK